MIFHAIFFCFEFILFLIFEKKKLSRFQIQGRRTTRKGNKNNKPEPQSDDQVN